ncbi:MAG: hypothetical protein LBE18_00825 [Planctomycetaceae bacterium]|nr:hypothetical protein [Planctomycetaceae bacterium]
MKKLLTLMFVAALSLVGSAVFADESGVAVTTSEAPIVIAPGFGHHGLSYGHYGADYGYAEKENILTRIANRLRAARAAREARKAAAFDQGFDGGYPFPKRKLFKPRNRFSPFGGHGFHGGYQEFPAEFQVGGYY